jgi:hypothetical protein
MLTRTKAWRSPLHEHLAEIRRMRRSRRTWQEIIDYLNVRHGLQLTRSGLCHFFRRATRRPLPMGFEEEGNAADRSDYQLRATDRSTKPGSRVTQHAESKPGPDNQEISIMPVNKPKKHPIFSSWTPEQGINYTPKN